MSMIASIMHDVIRPKVRDLVTILVSLLALVWLIGWLGSGRGLTLPGWSPVAAVRWILEGIGYRGPAWLNLTMTWLHDPSRRTFLVTVAVVAGLAASGGTLRQGPMRELLGPELAWALLLPAIEALGSRTAIHLAILGFLAPVPLALAAWIRSWPWVPASRRQFPSEWSLSGIVGALWRNALFFGELALLLPIVVGSVHLAYRDEGGWTPALPAERRRREVATARDDSGGKLPA